MRNIFRNLNKKHTYILTVLVLLCVASIMFVHNNHSFYERPIAEVIETHLEEATEVVDEFDNEDRLFTQHILAVLKNGPKKGQRIQLRNEYSSSKAFDQEYRLGDEVFVSVNSPGGNTELTGSIESVKRDTYIVFVGWIFIFTLLLVGKKQGLFSIISLIVNAALLSYALDIYINYSSISLLFICSVSIVLFTIISLALVNGFNEKTYAAIVATLLGTFTSLLITYFVLWVTSEQGLRYEEIQFITRPYQVVFMAGLFIGSLGAVMDVAITMSSSIFALYEKNHNIDIKALIQSGMEIGKDIMGTMTNILFFVYISGSIPTLLLYMKNEYPLGFILSINLSLELARALAGGIGIVLTIPIGLYISILFLKRKQAAS
nr:YibE/F family protein [Bacillus sp. HMF5848]